MKNKTNNNKKLRILSHQNLRLISQMKTFQNDLELYFTLKCHLIVSHIQMDTNLKQNKKLVLMMKSKKQLLTLIHFLQIFTTNGTILIILDE